MHDAASWLRTMVGVAATTGLAIALGGCAVQSGDPVEDIGATGEAVTYSYDAPMDNPTYGLYSNGDPRHTPLRMCASTDPTCNSHTQQSWLPSTANNVGLFEDQMKQLGCAKPIVYASVDTSNHALWMLTKCQNTTGLWTVLNKDWAKNCYAGSDNCVNAKPSPGVIPQVKSIYPLGANELYILYDPTGCGSGGCW